MKHQDFNVSRSGKYRNWQKNSRLFNKIICGNLSKSKMCYAVQAFCYFEFGIYNISKNT